MNIFSIILSLLFITTYLFNMKNFLNLKFKYFNTLSFICISIFFVLLTCIFNKFNTIIYIITYYGTSLIFFNSPLNKKLFITTFIYAFQTIVTIVAVLLGFLIVNIFRLTQKDFYFMNITFTIILLILMQIYFYLLTQKQMLYILFENKLFKNIIWILLICIFLINGIIPFTDKALTINYIIANIFLITSISFIAILTISIILIIYLNFNNHNMVCEKKSLDVQLHTLIKEQNITLEKNKNKNKILHDIKNHNITLKYLIENNNIPEAIEYINTFNSKINNSYSNKITNNPIINSILLEKLDLCKKNNIQFDIDCKLPNNININSFDLVTIFSNLLDNALEENIRLLPSYNKFISLKIYIQNELLFFKIINSSSTKTNINNLFFETKKEDKSSHGFGMKNIQEIVQKNNGIIKFSNEDFIFKAIGYLTIKTN